MRTSINVSVLGSSFVATVKTDDTGKVKLNDKGNHGYYANGAVNGYIVPETLPESIVVSIDGHGIEAKLKRNEDGTVKYSETGNAGWFANGKVNIDGTDHQVGGNITICKCGGALPQVGTVRKLQVGINIQSYVKATKGSTTKAKKGTKKAALVAAQQTVPTVTSAPPVAQMTLLEQVMASLSK